MCLNDNTQIPRDWKRKRGETVMGGMHEERLGKSGRINLEQEEKIKGIGDC